MLEAESVGLPSGGSGRLVVEKVEYGVDGAKGGENGPNRCTEGDGGALFGVEITWRTSGGEKQPEELEYVQAWS